MDPASLLALGRDPFSPTRNPDRRVPNAGFDRTLAAVLARVGRGERLIPLVGAPGTGKTLLLEAARRALEAKRPVRSVEQGDWLATALTGSPAVLLVDEGDRADAATVTRVVEGGWPESIVIAFSRPPMDGIAIPPAEQLRPLSASEARAHLLGRLAPTGRQRLFSRGAIDAVVGAAEGNPRTLSLIAGTALFHARSSGASDVDVDHVQDAIGMRGYLNGARVNPARTRARALAGMRIVPPVLGKRAILTAAVYVGVIGIALITRIIEPDAVRHQAPSRTAIASKLASPEQPTPFRLSGLDRDLAVRRSSANVVAAPPGSADQPLVAVDHEPPLIIPMVTKVILAEKLAPPARSQPTSALHPLRSTSLLSQLVIPPISAAPLPPVPPVLAVRAEVPPRASVISGSQATATLTESETARDDARAAREAAMEARDAMQLMRTARER